MSWDMLLNLQYSEQSQEHWNKYITRFKSGSGACARQHGVSVNLGDIFWQDVNDDPPINSITETSNNLWKMSAIGHSPKSKAYHSYGPANEEKALINKYFTSNTILYLSKIATM